MTGRAPAPTAAEIEGVARLLAKHWPGARQPLRPYLRGLAPWGQALRHVRILLKEAVSETNRGAKIPLAARATLMEFATRYGTETRGVVGVEPLTRRKNIRFGENGWEMIENAAAALGVDPAVFVRNAALMAAERGATSDETDTQL